MVVVVAAAAKAAGLVSNTALKCLLFVIQEGISFSDPSGEDIVLFRLRKST